ncbi:MAG: hypothetical protein JWM11_6375 [Planctomycetaceae bacterium]|nr:hypothetical protein [Planctomycetaceae bacterium]
MDQTAITQYISDTFDGVAIVVGSRDAGSPEIAWGDTFFIYDPGRQFPPAGQFPFATIVTKDYGAFDRASQLDRAGVFRLNIGVTKETYCALFGAQPSYPPEGHAVETGHDFAVLDQLLPHPVYASMSWVCVLNPSVATFRTVQPLLAEAYQLAVTRYAKREARR